MEIQILNRLEPTYVLGVITEYISFYFFTGESEDEHKPTPAPIRHWPTLDLLITMTYKLGDFMACLSYINIPLRENPEFEKGHKLKNNASF